MLRSHRRRHFFLAYLCAYRARKTIVITVLLKCVLSATFAHRTSNLPFFLPSFFPSNSNHHSPPSLAGSNSLSSLVCKGPLLSSSRRALIRSATLNKEGGGERERVIWKDRAAEESFECQSIRREGLQGPVTRVRLICVFQRENSRKGHHRRFASRCWPWCHSDREQSQAG